jgi:chorismate mutase
MSPRLDGGEPGAEVPASPAPKRGASDTVTDDPYVLKVRREISDLDSSLVELVNKRLRLVSQLKRYKDEHGIGFVDLAREQWMLQYLQRANRGPLTEEGLGELYHYVLELTKQEVTKADGA